MKKGDLVDTGKDIGIVREINDNKLIIDNNVNEYEIDKSEVEDLY